VTTAETLAARAQAWWSGYRPTPIPESEVPVLGLPDKVRACLFDLDGVLTDTASVHT
jgi:hypothetical protein